MNKIRALKIILKNGIILEFEDKTYTAIPFDIKDETTKELILSLRVLDSPKIEEVEVIKIGDRWTIKQDNLRLIDWKKVIPEIAEKYYIDFDNL